MWLSGNHRLTIVSIIVITGIAGALLMSTKNSQDALWASKQSGDFGTPQEAFDAASDVVRRYFSANEFGTFVIDSGFQSTLVSKSKMWIVKGYASCPEKDKVYEWTVIVNYDHMQKWEVLAKTVVPMSSRIEN